jgi:hypothetical protein
MFALCVKGLLAIVSEWNVAEIFEDEGITEPKTARHNRRRWIWRASGGEEARSQECAGHGD